MQREIPKRELNKIMASNDPQTRSRIEKVMQKLGEIDKILEDFMKNNTVIAVDGSKRRGNKTFTACICNDTNDEVRKVSHEIPGRPISPVRAELGGVFTEMDLVSTVAKWKEINP